MRDRCIRKVENHRWKAWNGPSLKGAFADVGRAYVLGSLDFE